MKKSDLILSSDEKVDLILWQFQEIERLKKENDELENKLLSPPKNSRKSKKMIPKGSLEKVITKYKINSC